MTENESSSFRLGSGPIEDAPQPEVPDDSLSQIHIKKLQRRGRITTFLLLCLTILLFAWGYWDLHNRFAHQANSGNREIKNITTVFDDRLNQLDQKFATIENQMGENFAQLDKLTVKLQEEIGQMQQNLGAIDVSGTMRKEKKAIQDEMQKALAPLKKDIDSLSQNVDASDSRVKTQLAPLEKEMAQMRQALTRLEKSIKAAAGASISQDDMALEMLKVKKAYQQKISSEAANIRREINLLAERLERIESKVRAAKAVSPPPSQSPGPLPGSGIQEQNLP
jgi:chromosome segregation ATPase